MYQTGGLGVACGKFDIIPKPCCGRGMACALGALQTLPTGGLKHVRFIEWNMHALRQRAKTRITVLSSPDRKPKNLYNTDVYVHV